MRATFISKAVLLVTIGLIVSGCGPTDGAVDDGPTGNIAAATEEYVLCTAALVSWNPDFMMCDLDLVAETGDWVLMSWTIVELELLSPDAHAGRAVLIRAGGDWDAGEAIFAGREPGEVFSLELPRPFLDGDYGSITPRHVRALARAAE